MYVVYKNLPLRGWMDSVHLLLAAGAGSDLQSVKYLTFKKCTYKIFVHWPFNSQRVHGTAACVKWSGLVAAKIVWLLKSMHLPLSDALRGWMDSVRLLLVAGVGGGSDCLPTTCFNFKITDEKIKTQKSWESVPLNSYMQRFARYGPVSK